MNQKNSKISAVVLTKNDEEKIKECLESLRWVDEVVLVDNESTDKTPQIAVNMGARVVTERVQINFSKLRNIGKEKATGEFLLYVDSDERVTAELKEEILDRVSNFNPETSSRTGIQSSSVQPG